ncbi:hypothetical protein M2459_000086 [Parabacteroides sp. PF5-5]|uniref:SusE domain-containing protein n=1 Tax=unclassified Parabacteroides TaxID=2649774 RepID=UPI002476529E|nr:MULTISPECIES: SusE domain-containing protein [unclassified Parabacteroides]MDH6303754.1 hypothetical protein [Parabacteroides sp. PH5-39]MDH6314371.1 hypothetical protein [Parabacteroides sp. PF5-13]MDH6318564.1 hypothetical protein [Parabacteroides sp. PH5-13]MDH6322143.1 hypothetical protein [Parabacteroides sp. PH5-8]MDH6325777.1 hypothetical protein [Parabacteroides sp. PH5-41]
MKKILSFIIILAGILPFIACEDDRDSNPTYTQPTSFVLNTPGLATASYDLRNAKTVVLTCTQPDYGFTAATTYSVEISLNDTWTGETEDVAATYMALTDNYTQAKLEVSAEEIDKVIVQLSKWSSEGDAPDSDMNIFVRLKATADASLPAIYSNSVKLTVLPYYIELKDAAPSFFFLIGNYVGGWDTNMKDVGTSLIPMSLVSNYEYDKKTGVGKFTYTEYFEAATSNNGFKLIGMIDGAISWNEQWGNGEDGDLPGNTDLQHLHNEGGNPGHLGVSESGWYKIDVDDVAKTLAFTKLVDEPKAYSSIQLLGDFSGWEENAVDMINIANTTHSWTATVTFDTEGTVKFRANAGWDTNWGNNDGKFPFALGDPGGDNIPVQPGTYIVTFNDIEGSYAFFIQE